MMGRVLITTMTLFGGCALQHAGDLARSGDVSGCTSALRLEGWDKYEARSKCEYIYNVSPDMSCDHGSTHYASIGISRGYSNCNYKGPKR